MRTCGIRLIIPFVLLAGVSACARKPANMGPTAPTPTERLAAADRLVRAGCLDCLLDGYREYQALRAIPTAGDAPALGAIRTVGLIALRQRELGMGGRGLRRLFAPVSAFVDVPLIAFRQAGCRNLEGRKLTALAAAEPRFVETALEVGVVFRRGS